MAAIKTLSFYWWSHITCDTNLGPFRLAHPVLHARKPKDVDAPYLMSTQQMFLQVSQSENANSIDGSKICKGPQTIML